MIYIENKSQHFNVRRYLSSFTEKQKELETLDESIYTLIPLYTALKYKILFDEFMLHPNMVRTRKFYEDVETINKKKDIVDKISEILQVELAGDVSDSKLSDKTIKRLIAAHKRLSKQPKNASTSARTADK